MAKNYGRSIGLEMKDFKYIDSTVDIKSEDSEWGNIKTGLYEPPEYIVKLLLLGVIKLVNLGPYTNKVYWRTQFSYRGHYFLIRDYKFGSWTIEGEHKNPEAIKLASEIESKIGKASLMLDKILKPAINDQIKKDDFYIHNEYYTLYNIFRFYRNKIKVVLKERDKMKAPVWDSGSAREFGSALTEYMNKHGRYGSEISNYSFALIAAFFSLQEFLFNVFYAFQNEGKGLLPFIKKYGWKEKFKDVYGPVYKGEIKQLHDGLLQLRNDFRNPLSHGLTNETRVLVVLGGTLVPLSIEYLSKGPQYDILLIKDEEAKQIIDRFDSMLKYISKTDPFRFYMLYLRGGFTIPATQKELAKIKAEMTDYKNFKMYVVRRAEYESDRMNRDI